MNAIDTPIANKKEMKIRYNDEAMFNIYIFQVVEGLESMTSNPVTSLAWVRSPGDALVV
jgi:hypothetical protein